MISKRCTVCLKYTQFLFVNYTSILKSRDIILLTKVHVVKVWMWQLNHKEGWVLKNWCFQVVVLEKTLESPLDCKEIQPVSPKGNQLWILTGRTDAEAEAPILWPPDVKSRLSGKDLDAGEDWGQEEKEVTQDEMVGWHYWFNGHEFEQTLGVGEGQWSLVCCSPWGHNDSDTTEWLSIHTHPVRVQGRGAEGAPDSSLSLPGIYFTFQSSRKSFIPVPPNLTGLRPQVSLSTSNPTLDIQIPTCMEHHSISHGEPIPFLVQLKYAYLRHTTVLRLKIHNSHEDPDLKLSIH